MAARAADGGEAGKGGYGAAGAPPNHGDNPPDYSTVTDPNAAPPSYESLYGEFRSVNNPRGFFDFTRKVAGVIVGTMIAAILIAIASMIPIAMIVIGSMNLHDCPIERYVPIYLIVGGCFGLFKSITNFYYRAKNRNDPEANPESNVNPNPFDGILNCFLLAWFIAGTVWVYRIYRPNMENASSPDYCDPLTYWFTFTLITLTYAMMGIFVFFMCCCGCVALCCGRSETE